MAITGNFDIDDEDPFGEEFDKNDVVNKHKPKDFNSPFEEEFNRHDVVNRKLDSRFDKPRGVAKVHHPAKRDKNSEEVIKQRLLK
ncbi:MAG: hypothetical protein QG635_75, partial [Bacteroidota bacterium]|nr:hypothetical protein [Bacteroidota bacterium]